MAQTSLKLIYFKGCPNAKVAIERLSQIGVGFEKICQDDLDADSPYRAFASPTLLKGNTVVFGAATGKKGGCSLDLPDIPEIKARLR